MNDQFFLKRGLCLVTLVYVTSCSNAQFKGSENLPVTVKTVTQEPDPQPPTVDPKPDIDPQVNPPPQPKKVTPPIDPKPQPPTVVVEPPKPDVKPDPQPQIVLPPPSDCSTQPEGCCRLTNGTCGTPDPGTPQNPNPEVFCYLTSMYPTPKGFSDVPDSSTWTTNTNSSFDKVIKAASLAGIIAGMPGGTFGKGFATPEQAVLITFGATFCIAARATNPMGDVLIYKTLTSKPYDDVSMNAWYAKQIATAKAYGLLNVPYGDLPGQSGPNTGTKKTEVPPGSFGVGNHIIVGDYFMMMNKAIQKFYESLGKRAPYLDSTVDYVSPLVSNNSSAQYSTKPYKQTMNYLIDFCDSIGVNNSLTKGEALNPSFRDLTREYAAYVAYNVMQCISKDLNITLKNK